MCDIYDSNSCESPREKNTKFVIQSDGQIVDFDNILTTTRTVIAITNLKINIEKFFKYMPITSYIPVEKKRGRKRKTQAPVLIQKIPVGSIISMKYGDVVKGVVLKKKKSKKSADSIPSAKKPDDYFRHSISCVMMLEDNKQLNIKVPSNGKLQMTGCKSDEHSILAITSLCKIMKEVEKWTGEKLFTMEGNIVKVIYNIVMQNKDFKIGFRINRQNLDTFINRKTEYCSIFEASTSTGINIKIKNNANVDRKLTKIEYNIDTDHLEKGELSYDSYYDLLDEKEKELEKSTKYITFFVFSSGHIIMSGREHNMKNFFYSIVNILLKYRNEFEEKSDIRKIEKPKKIRRTKVIIDEEDGEEI